MRIQDSLALVASAQFGLGSAYDCHVYALRAPEGIVLIDAGAGYTAEAILGRLHHYWPGTPLADVILTHTHPDHACGAVPLQQATGCRIHAPAISIAAIHNGDEFTTGLAEARSRGMYPEDLRLLPCPAAIPFDQTNPILAAGLTLQPFHIRGHSHDSHCLLLTLDNRRMLFSGDTLFYGPIFGVINREDSGMSGYRADLQNLSELAIDALLPGHGLFTLSGGQRHIDEALRIVDQGFLPRQIGQFDLLF